MIRAILPILLLIALFHPAMGKDCTVGESGGFVAMEDNKIDAEEMKKLHGALKAKSWLSHQRNTSKWDAFMSGFGSMCNVEGVCCVKHGDGGGNRVVELYWERNKLKGSFPDTFYKMDQIVNMDFHLNFIKNFPPKLSKMPKLKSAQFGRNPICGAIPDDFMNFGPQLTKLDCNFCCLSGSFPDMFGNLPNLEELYMCGNNFTGHLPPTLSNLSGLTKTSFNLNSFTGPVPAGLGILPLLHDCRIGGDTDFKPYDTSDGSPEKKWLLKWVGNDFDCPVPNQIMGGICNNKGPKYQPGHYGPPSLVKCGGPPKPPAPTPPSPAPTPGPSPPAGDCAALVSKCFSRCEKKYGGKISDIGSAAENCAKGCAGMSKGKVIDHDQICGLPVAQREVSCQRGCKTSSTHPDRIADCEYGCGFWSNTARGG